MMVMVTAMVMMTVVVMVTAVMMLVVEFEMSYWGMVVLRWEKGVNFPVEMIGVDLTVLLVEKTGEGFLIVVVVMDELEKMVVAIGAMKEGVLAGLE
jgi:hypothetical protein